MKETYTLILALAAKKCRMTYSVIHTLSLQVRTLLLLLTVFILHQQAAAQCMTYFISLSQRIENSRYIVKGKVSRQTAYKDAKGNIYTLNMLDISNRLKGNEPLPELGIITLGGELGNEMQLSYPSLQLDTEKEYLFFVEADNFTIDNKEIRSLYPNMLQSTVYAESQGALPYENGYYQDAAGKHEFIEEQSLFDLISKSDTGHLVTTSTPPLRRLGQNNSIVNAVVVSSVTPNITKAGTVAAGDYITITGSGFGATQGANNVSFPNADDGGASWINPIATDYLSWSDGSITVKVPERAGSGNIVVAGTLFASPITVGYAHSAISSTFNGFGSNTRQRYYLRDKNGSGGYTLSLNSTSGFSGNSSAVNTLQDAMDTWTCNTAINWNLGPSTTTGFGNDGENVVLFDNTLPAGVLGRMTSRFSASATGACNTNNTVWWVNELDLQVRPDPPTAGTSWEYGPSTPSSTEYDMETLLLHELGHAHGLGHRIAPGQTMHYAMANGTSARSLDTNEIRAGIDKIAYSTASTCFDPTGSGAPMVGYSCSFLLPVELIIFEGEKVDAAVLLHWTTASEHNNREFIIERSKDAIHFEPIGMVDGAGNSNREQDYSFTDNEPYEGISYYRLKQKDFDGKIAYSNIIRIVFEHEQNFSTQISPNPADDKINLLFNSINRTEGMIQIYEISGKRIFSESLSFEEGINKRELDVSSFAKGVYLIEINTGEKSYKHKLVKR